MSAMQPVQLRGVNLRRQFAFYPFSSATYDDIESDTDFRTGIDMFWRPSSNLQLTTTLNPDFGTVETDDVVINLSAFETFFSEKRLFFLEGNGNFRIEDRWLAEIGIGALASSMLSVSLALVTVAVLAAGLPYHRHAGKKCDFTDLAWGLQPARG